VRFQPVEVLSREAERAAVSGVEAGVRVVVDGAGFLGDGDVVRIAPPAAAAPASAPAASN
jgi:hypothetical protein